jgi:putative tryptophan/tyrosine transport system substrate-binding protein
MPKRMEMLRELVSSAASIAYLFNPTNFSAEVDDVKNGAPLLGLRLVMIEASRQSEIGPAFDKMMQLRPDVLVVSSDLFFTAYRGEVVALTIRHRIPSMFATREAVQMGGLMSYGVNGPELWRQVGIYVGRILNGEKPADLPVQQPTRFEMAINLRTAKALGLMVPQSILLRADEVIE